LSYITGASAETKSHKKKEEPKSHKKQEARSHKKGAGIDNSKEKSHHVDKKRGASFVFVCFYESCIIID
jgi:hypothetical protein